MRGRPPGLAGGISGASRAYCSSLRACPAPKSPTSARLSVVHMACLQEGLLPSRTGRRPACATRSPRRRRLLKRPLSTAPANAAPSPGPLIVRNAAYSQCIDAPGGALNVRLKLVECSGSDTQQWVFMPTVAANTYVIQNQASGFCMEVNNGTSTPGETVDEFTCNGLASEQWVLEGLTFRHAETNQCLDTVSGPGSQLMQWTCGDAHPANVQSWTTAPPPPPRSISVSKEGTGSSTAFIVNGVGFTPGSLIVIRITDAQLQQIQFPETAGGDGKFVSRHGVPCFSGGQLTFTAFEDTDPSGTFANIIVTTCP